MEQESSSRRKKGGIMKEKEPKAKRGRGRPVTKQMPDLIPDTPENIARAVLTSADEGSTRRMAVFEEAEGLVSELLC